MLATKSRRGLSFLAHGFAFPLRRRGRRRRREFVVVDFRDQYVKLPNGKIIPKERILSIDTERKVIVYLDDDYTVREASYGAPTTQRAAAQPRVQAGKRRHEEKGKSVSSTSSIVENEVWNG